MRNTATAIAAAVLALTLTSCGGTEPEPEPAAITPAAVESTPAGDPLPDAAPDTVGMRLDEARDALTDAGIPRANITVEDVRDGKMVLSEKNWTVVQQTGTPADLHLGVEKIEAAKPDSADDEQRADAITQAISDAFGGATPGELLAEDPTSWAGYINGVRVEGANAYITLQISADDTGRDDLGSRAARALSTLLPAEAVDGIDWLIVEDVSGVVIAQEQPNPLT